MYRQVVDIEELQMLEGNIKSTEELHVLEINITCKGKLVDIRALQ
jgi:hypothetical protein